MLRSNTIKNFLTAKTHFDLASLYNKHMEVQVIVAQGTGDRVEGDFKGRKNTGYTDGLQTWYPFRIPRNANTIPEDNDTEIKFDLAVHAEGIGMTGWNWHDKVSMWFGYDFDAITGHSDKHSARLSDIELAEVERVVANIPWVTVRRSTGGNGRHLYVFVQNIQTQNHNEHAALARAVLGTMAGITGFDFASKVDALGGNMWVWHSKMTVTNRGLELLKAGIPLLDIPENWKDHIHVITGRRKKILPVFVEEEQDGERLFMELTGQQTHVTFDEDHKKLLAWLSENNYYCQYESDHHMIITHTYGLKKAHEDLNLKGVFNTVSEGTDLNTPNCYMFAMRRGAWSVRRYTPGITESPSWDQDNSGWTRCYLNKEPDLKIAAKAFEGLEHPSGGFVFPSAYDAQQAASMLGANLDLPSWALHKKAKLKENKDGKLVAEVDYDNQSDPMRGGLAGWIAEGKLWKRVFNTQVSDPTESELGNFDDIVRHLLSPDAIDLGWSIKANGRWQDEPLAHVGKAMKSLNFAPKEVEIILGQSIFKGWTIVNKPFQTEYPGDRQWNRKAAQFRFAPSQDKDNLHYPTWLKMLTHLGHSLDDAMVDHPWCKTNGVRTGSDYLKCWIASLFQFPLEPLPYLFFYGPENTGKSTFHEALSLLIVNGVKRADNAITSQGSFNAELEHAIVGIVEETDLKRNKQALNLLKDWVTSPIISIHRKGETPYDIQNTTHWCQTSNSYDACPVFTGDTRITMIFVDHFQDELIPKKLFKELLIKEAPDFMAEVLSLEIPHSPDRLNIPIIITDEKLQAQRNNQTELESFISEICYHVPGECLRFSDFYNRFAEWLDPNQIYEWSKTRVGRELPPEYPHGRITSSGMGGQFYIGNIAFEKKTSTRPRYINKGEKLVPIMGVTLT